LSLEKDSDAWNREAVGVKKGGSQSTMDPAIVRGSNLKQDGKKEEDLPVLVQGHQKRYK